MALIHPVKKVFITQQWGANPQVYSRFGLLGHNGIDYRAFLPNGQRCYVGDKSEVFAPHSGTVIENRYDANGYGWYVKIENDKEGSILGHFSSQSPLKINQHVNQGSFVGYQGNTGFSSGIHLHWGYYPKPRNRSNGYSGTINQLPLIGEGADVSEELQACLKDREMFWNQRDEIFRELNTDNLEGAKKAVQGLRSRITDLANQLGSAQAEAENRTEQVSRLKDEVLSLEEDVISLNIKANNYKEEVNQFARDKASLAVEVKQLKAQNESLKQGLDNGSITLSIRDIFELLWNQKITLRPK